jgi:hypothetical protein
MKMQDSPHKGLYEHFKASFVLVWTRYEDATMVTTRCVDWAIRTSDGLLPIFRMRTC